MCCLCINVWPILHVQLLWHFLITHVMKNWATYVLTGWRFTLSIVWYQLSLRLTFGIVSLRSWSSVRKPNFAVMPVLLGISSLIHYNVISSWINGRFTGLSAFILKEFLTFSVLNVKSFYVTQAKSRYLILRWTCSKRKWQKKNVTSFLDACLHTPTQIRMVNYIICTFSKS